jgi:hypothetical protein
MRRLALALALFLLCAAPARALTVENVSDTVLYCSVYRQGYAIPLTQFVLLPGKKHHWSPAMRTTFPLVVRAMAERHLVKCVQPASCTVRDQYATVVADQDNDILVLDVQPIQPVR